jgi:O-antigen/teichoic acid export membrane protein
LPAAIANEGARDNGALDVAAVLLVLQAGLGLVSAAGVLFLTIASGGAPLYAAALLVALVGPGLALLLARGMTRCRRWARNGVIAYEALILIGAGVRFFFDRDVALGLVVTLTSVVLPLAVCGLVLSPGARRAIAVRRRRRIKPDVIPVAQELPRAA